MFVCVRGASARRVPIVCPPCGNPGTLHGPAVTLKFAPKRPTPLTTGVALNEVAWKDDKGQEVDCTICAYPMSADSGANPWTGPGLFLTQACVNGHVYHKGCLLTHMSRSNNSTATCPECRNPILSEVTASGGGGGGLFSGLGGGGGGGMKVTLVQYEFNELTDEEGDAFLSVLPQSTSLGVPGGLGQAFTRSSST